MKTSTAPADFARLTGTELYALHNKLFNGQTKAYARMDNLTARAPGWDTARALFDEITWAMRTVRDEIRDRARTAS